MLPGTIGLLMATETIKLLLRIGQTLTGRLLLFNSLKMGFKEVRVRRNPKCDLCGDHPTVTSLIDYEAFCNVPLPAAAAPARPESAMEISGAELKRILDKGRPVTLLDVREPHEWEINHIDRARLTPLSKFESYISELNPEDEIYLYCYKGKRSLTALKKLQERGFKHLRSLSGGIDRWAQEIDPSMPRY